MDFKRYTLYAEAHNFSAANLKLLALRLLQAWIPERAAIGQPF
jgi:hypothetical protein